MTKFISAKEATALIKDGATVAASGFCGFASCDELFGGIREHFDETGHPKNLTIIKGVSIGDFGERGVSKIGREGLISKLICAHVGLEPSIVKLITENKIMAYMLPLGTIIDIINAAGSKKPCVITKVGLGTFADPLNEGSKVNEFTKNNGEDIVERIEINGEECLLYKPIPVDVCLLRVTYADEDGNLSLSREAISADQLELAIATRNSGGIVIAQVEQIVAKGSIRPRDIRIHHFMVDYVVKANPENHMQSFDCDYYRPELTGEIKIPLASIPPMPLDNRKVCGRRAAMELRKHTLINLGIGMSESVAAVAGEEGVSEEFTLSIESGVLGGVPLGGLGLGGTVNPEAIYNMGDILAVYDGGGLDMAVLGRG
ncbi:MAG: 3-oxoacid CoA-transferase, partial [Eubacteriales bacterium]|nr:3-oxoacid CoA-transferase [Eubacteriales bacterium]